MDPPLLTLPPEIRDQIFEYLFFGAELSTFCKCHRPNPFQRANYGILSANKQLHHEASSTLFRGAVLRLHIPNTTKRHVPPYLLTTTTVLPVWSWYIRDKYRDCGTDVEFLRRWWGGRIERAKHFEIYLPFKDGVEWLASSSSSGRYVRGCEMAVQFLNGLPEVESLTVYTDADDVRWVRKCRKALRGLRTAKVVMLARDGGCGRIS